jgi:hypothetical protein
MPLSILTASFLGSHHSIVDLHQSLYALRLQEAENALSSLVLIALMTYFYTAFGKFFESGGIGRNEVGSDHGEEVAHRKLGSPIYYSSAAAA